MAGLFKDEALDISKLKLSDWKKPEKKVVKPILEKKKEVRINKVSTELVPPFHSEEERLKHFPNPPKGMKSLNIKPHKENEIKERWINGKYVQIR